MGYSIISALLIFYVIIINCFTHDLIAKQVKTLVDNDRNVQHIISMLMLFTIIMILMKENVIKSVLYTLLGYSLYVLSTKMDIQMNLIVFTILLTGFIYEHNSVLKEEQMNKDPVLTFDDRANVMKKQNNNKTMIGIMAIIIIVAGTGFYYSRKTVQHAGHFSNGQFFLS